MSPKTRAVVAATPLLLAAAWARAQPDPRATIHIDFIDASIPMLIETMSRITERTYVYDQRELRGRITFKVTTTRLDLDEQFATVLAMRGLSINESEPGVLEIDLEDRYLAVFGTNGAFASALMSPRFLDGRMFGAVITAMPSGGLLEQLGVARGDVLLQVNGIQIIDVPSYREITFELRDAPTLRLIVESPDGSRRILDYEEAEAPDEARAP